MRKSKDCVGRNNCNKDLKSHLHWCFLAITINLIAIFLLNYHLQTLCFKNNFAKLYVFVYDIILKFNIHSYHTYQKVQSNDETIFWHHTIICLSIETQLGCVIFKPIKIQCYDWFCRNLFSSAHFLCAKNKYWYQYLKSNHLTLIWLNTWQNYLQNRWCKTVSWARYPKISCNNAIDINVLR